jgi:4-hydroxy-tetrahydrodipicolinate reductase
LGIESLKVQIGFEPKDWIEKSDVIIDFSSPEASLRLLRAAKDHKRPVVIGTTGFHSEHENEIQKLAKGLPCVRAPNMSVGVNLLFKLVEEAAKVLGEAYDVEVIEAHHRLKKDAPRGTARGIVEILAKALGRNIEKDVVSGRQGIIGERKSHEIGVFAVRAGDIIGDHTILFAGQGERLELIHRAHSREPFAQGALRAARFVMRAKPGFYTMQDVLGIK